MNLLVFYLLFIMVALLVVGYLITKLDVPHPQLVMVALAFLIVSPIVISYVYTTYIAPVPEVDVPNVRFLSVKEARKKLKNEGLKGRISEKAYERTVPEGKVISQRPEAGRRVKLGRVVNLKVSIGERMVLVPNLVGRPLTQIEVVLSEAGLKIGERKIELSEQYQSGIVIGQEPLPEEEVSVGSEVDVLIAENPNFGIVKVPDLVSRTVEDARETLNQLKLNAVVFFHETVQFDPGMVISQDPIGGEELRMGDVVKLYISKKPEIKSESPTVETGIPDGY